MDIGSVMGLMIPFIGTSAGAAVVFFMKKGFSRNVHHMLTGFAGGVMTAASVWSLIIPAIEQSADMGAFSFFPAFSGFWLGIFFLLVLSKIIPKLTVIGEGSFSRTVMMILAVTLHNIPEGMAVGVAYAGLLSGSAEITAGGALALSIGIGIQNLPEGAIISMPLHAQGKGRGRSFICGILSGVVEPVFGCLTITASWMIAPALPYLLSFAAGAMIYVVVQEMIPEITEGDSRNTGILMFSSGFTLMMAMDVALG